MNTKNLIQPMSKTEEEKEKALLKLIPEIIVSATLKEYYEYKEKQGDL